MEFSPDRTGPAALRAGNWTSLFLVVLGACSLVSMAAETEPWGKAALFRLLADQPHGYARFTERRFIAVLQQPVMSSGTLKFERPHRLEKRTQNPDKEHLLISDGVLVIERPEDNTRRVLMLEQQPALAAFIEGIRATLLGDLETLEKFYALELRGNRNAWRLDLQPRPLKLQKFISSIRIEGADAQVTSIETRQANGDISVMTIVAAAP